MRQIKPSIFAYFILIVFNLNLAEAKKVIVSSADAITNAIGELSDGDTLYIESGTYTIGNNIAPNGLIISTKGYKSYKDIVIMGNGMTQTVIDFNGNYGFMALKSENLLIKDLSIENAAFNGGIYVQEGEMNLENVAISNCSSSTSTYKNQADGGAVCYSAGSAFSYITGCKFTNNTAANAGGALAITLTSSQYSQTQSLIECNEFSNNTATEKGSAISFYSTQQKLIHENNIVWGNTGGEASIYIDSKKYSYITNNTVTQNSAGLYLKSSHYNRCFFNNNCMVDNTNYDVKGQSNSTILTGDYNVCKDLSNTNYRGSFNDDVKSNVTFYDTSAGQLSAKQILMKYLVGRVPANATLIYDFNQQARQIPSDIGAQNLPFTDKVAVWTGTQSQDFSDATNWLNGLQPHQSEVTVISNTDITTYPIISNSVESSFLGNLANSDILITANGILENRGNVVTDTFTVESQMGGTGQFLNTGSLTSSLKQTEYYLNSNSWVPIYISEEMSTAEDILPNLVYGTDYTICTYSPDKTTTIKLNATDLIDTNIGYYIKSNKVETAIFDSYTNTDVNFSIRYNSTDNSPFAGLNLIGNPYEVALTSDMILKDDLSAMNGAIYVYDGDRFKAWVNGIGNEEASVIMPHQAFYVQAKSASSDNYNLSLPSDKAYILNYKEKDTEDNDSSKILEIKFSDENNTIIDNTYLNVTTYASDDFDSKYDAIKLSEIAGQTLTSIYTSDINDNPYAINSIEAPEENTKSVALNISIDQDEVSTTPLVMHFAFNAKDSIGYLLHDSTRDSSKSVILEENAIINAAKSTDSIALNNRFSLQIFKGKVPFEVENTITRINSGYKVTYPVKQIVTTEEKQKGDPITTIYNDTVDNKIYTITTDSIFFEVIDTFTTYEYKDTTYRDTTFTDTYYLLGTYRYMETTYKTEITKHTRETLKTIEDSIVVSEKIVVDIDSALVSSIKTPIEASGFRLHIAEGELIVTSSTQTPCHISIYDISGKMEYNTILPMGNGQIPVSKGKVLIVKIETENSIITEKLIY